MAYYTNGNLAYQYQDKLNKQNKSHIKIKGMPAGEKLFYLSVVIFVVFLASIVISGYAQIAEYNYKEQKLEKSISSINEENETLQRKIAELSTTDRIIDIAENKLGMTLDESRIVVLPNK